VAPKPKAQKLCLKNPAKTTSQALKMMMLSHFINLPRGPNGLEKPRPCSPRCHLSAVDSSGAGAVDSSGGAGAFDGALRGGRAQGDGSSR